MPNPFNFGKDSAVDVPALGYQIGPLGRATGPAEVRYVSVASGDLTVDGYRFFPSALPPESAGALRQSVMAALPMLDSAAVIHDDNGQRRMAFGTHLISEGVNRIARSNVWIGAISKALGGPIYVYQTKVTINPSHSSAGWGWHQDFGPWQHRDGVPEPLMCSAVVFLDDVLPENGGVAVVPGSHKLDSQSAAALIQSMGTSGSNGARYQPVSPIGPAGSVLVFHALTVHGSSLNVSSHHRNLLIVTYNRCSNVPTRFDSAEWLCARDVAPLRH